MTDSYLAFSETQIDVFAADEAQYEIADWLSDVLHVVSLNEQGFKWIVWECLCPEFDVIVTDIGQHCRLWVYFIVFASFRDDRTFNVAEKTIVLVKFGEDYTMLWMPGPMPLSRIFLITLGLSILKSLLPVIDDIPSIYLIFILLH